ncbi:hypothetical protein ACFLUL_00770 [Chloroflexota bacterium]
MSCTQVVTDEEEVFITEEEETAPTEEQWTGEFLQVDIGTNLEIVGVIDFIQDPGYRLTGAESGAIALTDPCVVQLPDGRYRMYTSAQIPDIIEGSAMDIYSFVSSDGISWAWEEGARVAHSSNEEDQDHNLGVPAVFQGTDSRWYMTMSARRPFTEEEEETAPPDRRRHITLMPAVSDDGLNWTKYPDKLFPGPDIWAINGDAIVIDDQYILYYGSPYNSGAGQWQAISTNGINWETKGPVFNFGHDPDVIEYRGQYYMFYVYEVSETVLSQLTDIDPEMAKSLAERAELEEALGKNYRKLILLAVSDDGLVWSNKQYIIRPLTPSGEDYWSLKMLPPGGPFATVLPDGQFILYGGMHTDLDKVISFRPVNELP